MTEIIENLLIELSNQQYLDIFLYLFISCTTKKERQMLTSGIDFSRVDSTVRPQDDFYKHVNGKWLKEFELESQTSYAYQVDQWVLLAHSVTVEKLHEELCIRNFINFRKS